LASAKDLPPGGVGEIKVTFRTRGYQGPVTKTISVETNDPANRQVRLTLKGRVVADVVVEPKIINFGSVNRRALPDPLPLKVALRSGKDLRITEVRSDNSFVVVTPTPGGRQGGESEYSVALTKDVPAGRVAGRILVKTTSQSLPEVQVPVHALVEGNVRVTPPLVSLGVVRPGEKVTRELRVERTGDVPFSVEKVVSTNENLSVSVINEKPGEAYRLVVTYQTGPSEEGRISERLSVFAKSDTEEILEVPVFGSFQPPRPPQAQPPAAGAVK